MALDARTNYSGCCLMELIFFYVISKCKSKIASLKQEFYCSWFSHGGWLFTFQSCTSGSRTICTNAVSGSGGSIVSAAVTTLPTPLVDMGMLKNEQGSLYSSAPKSGSGGSVVSATAATLPTSLVDTGMLRNKQSSSNSAALKLTKVVRTNGTFYPDCDPAARTCHPVHNRESTESDLDSDRPLVIDCDDERLSVGSRSSVSTDEQPCLESHSLVKSTRCRSRHAPESSLPSRRHQQRLNVCKSWDPTTRLLGSNRGVGNLSASWKLFCGVLLAKDNRAFADVLQCESLNTPRTPVTLSVLAAGAGLVDDVPSEADLNASTLLRNLAGRNEYLHGLGTQTDDEEETGAGMSSVIDCSHDETRTVEEETGAGMSSVMACSRDETQTADSAARPMQKEDSYQSTIRLRLEGAAGVSDAPIWITTPTRTILNRGSDVCQTGNVGDWQTNGHIAAEEILVAHGHLASLASMTMGFGVINHIFKLLPVTALCR